MEASPDVEPEAGFGLEGLLTRVKDIVGEDAGYAMFHYAALEEGKRIAAPPAPREPKKILQRLDRILGQRSELLEQGPPVIIKADPRYFDIHNVVLQGIVLGMLEGAFSALNGHEYRGECEEGDGSVVITLEATHG